MITLNAGGYTAWIVPERGGSCVRLSRLGADALRTPENPAAPAGNPYLYGTPLLFPPNRISGARFSFAGREYRFPVNEPKTGCFLHGTLHETPFSVIAQSEDAVTLRYAATAEKPYLTFPHAFLLTVAWTLSEAGLRQQVEFTNVSSSDMPVALAFHTTFRVPFCPDSAPEDVRLSLDAAAEYSRNMENYLPDGGVTDDFPQKRDMETGAMIPSAHTISRLFRMGGKHEMTLTDDRAGLRVRYRAGDSYRYWMVFNGGDPHFLCVEPQSWLSNCPNAPFPRAETGFDALAPGQSRAYETWLSIEKT